MALMKKTFYLKKPKEVPKPLSKPIFKTENSPKKLQKVPLNYPAASITFKASVKIENFWGERWKIRMGRF